MQDKFFWKSLEKPYFLKNKYKLPENIKQELESFWENEKNIIDLMKFFNNKIDYVFLAYPENENSIKYYCDCENLNKKYPFFGGLFNKNKSVGLGVIFYFPYFGRDLLKNKNQENIVFWLDKMNEIIKPKYIAGAGILPTILFKKYKKELPKNFLGGEKGTVYSVLKNFFDLGGNQESKIIVTGSAGRIAQTILKFFENKNFKDVKVFEDYLRKDNPEVFKDREIILNFFRQGNGLEKYLNFIKKGTLVIDDSYPPIENKKILEKFDIKKVLIKSDDIVPIYKIPGFGYNLPGCVVEAVIKSSNLVKTEKIDEYLKIGEKLNLKSPYSSG